MSQVAGPFSPRVRWLLESPVDIRMTRRRLSRGLRWMDHRARKSENLREVTDSSTLHSPVSNHRNALRPAGLLSFFYGSKYPFPGPGQDGLARSSARRLCE